jgi:hypothetical protein
VSFTCAVPAFTVPEVACKVVLTLSGTWAAFVDLCPFCGSNHYHAAGSSNKPTLGYRALMCRFKYHSAYTLIDA